MYGKMQVSNSNIEQPTSPSSLSSLPITPKSSKEMMEIITKLLQKGQESAQFLRGLKLDDDHQDSLDHHCLVALNSFKDALCIIQSFDFDHEDAVIRKRKLDRTDNNESFDHAKAEDNGRGETCKERRGCYKRRKTGETWIVEDTILLDDGHTWRKYGQKGILNAKYPRSYYRCTHKYDQSYPCQATKQVQQISDNPTKYNIIYNGLHTCKNTHKSSPIIINNPHKNSPYFLCFENNNYQTVNSLASHSNSAMVNQEYCTSTITEELTISPSVPHDVDHLSGTHSNLQSSSSSEITSSTPVSDQGDSLDYGLDEDNLVNFMMNMDFTHDHLDEIMNYY